MVWGGLGHWSVVASIVLIHGLHCRPTHRRGPTDRIDGGTPKVREVLRVVETLLRRHPYSVSGFAVQTAVMVKVAELALEALVAIETPALVLRGFIKRGFVVEKRREKRGFRVRGPRGRDAGPPVVAVESRLRRLDHQLLFAANDLPHARPKVLVLICRRRHRVSRVLVQPSAHFVAEILERRELPERAHFIERFVDGSRAADALQVSIVDDVLSSIASHVGASRGVPKCKPSTGAQEGG